MELTREGYGLVRVEGKLDARTPESHDLTVILEREPEEVPVDYAIDLSGVTYINSSMLGLLVRFMSACHAAGRELFLLAPAPSVENVLRLTGFTDLMPILSTEEEIRQHLGAPSDHGHHTPSDLDYGRLTEEIEEIILAEDEERARARRCQGELRKLLGEDAD